MYSSETMETKEMVQYECKYKCGKTTGSIFTTSLVTTRAMDPLRVLRMFFFFFFRSGSASGGNRRAGNAIAAAAGGGERV